ncbi:MAG: 4-hydroxy-tetrahydrodipicolinate synthase, partial [Alphaproteobacteria bacterium]
RDGWLTNLPMLHFAYSAINPVAVKSLMRAVGLPAGPLRAPLQQLDPAALQKGLDICRDLGLDEKYGYRLDTATAIAAE